MSNEIMLEDSGALEPGEIMTDSVRQWRADCQTGNFKIGAATMRGPKIDMEIVAAKIEVGEFFKYKMQPWLAVVFIDPDGVLSSMLFKTESLDNFEEMRRQKKLKGESLLGKTIRAAMSQRAGTAVDQNGEKVSVKYYAVEFEVVSEGKYAEAIAAFREQTQTSAMFPRLSGPAN